MGSTNYGKSEYITLGIRSYDNSVNYDDISACYDADYSNIEYLISKCNFYYFHIEIKPGYYDGFYLDIENNYPVAFDCFEDKRDAQKEITDIKSFLIDCAGCGLVAVSPGWCTGYADYKGTISAIKKAVSEMRETVKSTPTWRQYNRTA